MVATPKKKGIAGRVRLGENVYALRTRHLWHCKLVQQGGDVLREIEGGGVWHPRMRLPDYACSCGAFDPNTRSSRHVILGKNIVTDDGNVYIAELYAGESPTNFGDPYKSLTTAQNAPAASSDFSDLTTIPTLGTLAIDGSYPQTDDADADNPGTTDTDVTTWRVSWGTANANGTIIGCAIHQNGASGTDPLLMHAAFASSFVKTSADTLKTYVNHTIVGQA